MNTGKDIKEGGVKAADPTGMRSRISRFCPAGIFTAGMPENFPEIGWAQAEQKNGKYGSIMFQICYKRGVYYGS